MIEQEQIGGGRPVNEAAKAHEEKLERNFKWLMRNSQGRMIVYELLALSGVFRTTFVETPARAHYMAEAMAFEEGRKQLGYRLLARIMKSCPEKYALMIKENANG